MELIKQNTQTQIIKSLLGINLDDLTDDKLKELSSEILKSKIHGEGSHQRHSFIATLALLIITPAR